MDTPPPSGSQSPVPPMMAGHERSIGRIGRIVVSISLGAFVLVALFKPG